MIIKGLSKRFAEIGKIKIGCKGEKIKSKNDKEFYQPKKYGHFVVTTTERDNNGNFVIDHEIMKLLGDKPKEIAIRLPFDSIDLNFFTSFQLYQGHKCVCRGNGETAIRTFENGTEKEIECKNEGCEYLQKGNCKVSGILSCYLACKLELGGVYRFRTHSWNSVSNILSALQDFSLQTGGILLGMPLKLKMFKKSTAEHGNVDVVTVVLDNAKVSEIIEFRQLALKEKESRKMLSFDVAKMEETAKAAGFTKDTDDPSDVQDEFYVTKQDKKMETVLHEDEPEIIDIPEQKENTESKDDKHQENIPKLNIKAKNIWAYVNKLPKSYPEESKKEMAVQIRAAFANKNEKDGGEELLSIIAILEDILIKAGITE